MYFLNVLICRVIAYVVKNVYMTIDIENFFFKYVDRDVNLIKQPLAEKKKENSTYAKNCLN